VVLKLRFTLEKESGFWLSEKSAERNVRTQRGKKYKKDEKGHAEERGNSHALPNNVSLLIQRG
jgi:hypothetical protein